MKMKRANPRPPDDPAGTGTADERTLPALDWLRRAGAERELLVEVAVQVRRRRRRRLAFASSVSAVLVLFAGFAWNAGGNRAASVPVAGQATVSAPERQVLPD